MIIDIILPALKADCAKELISAEVDSEVTVE
jgi:predicted transcriptional regulator